MQCLAADIMRDPTDVNDILQFFTRKFCSEVHGQIVNTQATTDQQRQATDHQQFSMQSSMQDMPDFTVSNTPRSSYAESAVPKGPSPTQHAPQIA